MDGDDDDGNNNGNNNNNNNSDIAVEEKINEENTRQNLAQLITCLKALIQCTGKHNALSRTVILPLQL